MSVKLGDQVRDRVTGFTGVVTSRTEFLNGCVRCGVQPPVKVGEENKFPDSIAFDIEQLEPVVVTPVEPDRPGHVPEAPRRRTGGDRPLPRDPDRLG